jgi:hypothetical protein
VKSPETGQEGRLKRISVIYKVILKSYLEDFATP